VPVLLATEDGSAGISGFVTVAVEQHLASQRGRPPAIYACGPEGLLAALFEICRRRELPGQLSVERYMKCGFGLCGQCALDDILVCLDGPVLDWRRARGQSRLRPLAPHDDGTRAGDLVGRLAPPRRVTCKGIGHPPHPRPAAASSCVPTDCRGLLCYDDDRASVADERRYEQIVEEIAILSALLFSSRPC
jgi:hypothetical protein